LDLTDPANINLLNIGGYIYVQNVIVARALDGSYFALSQICTHAGCNVEYQVFSDELSAPAMESLRQAGKCEMGTATAPLFEYGTQLSGILLHVNTP
jgi:cytochrome b6-f complex iron-sulfur subunit